MLVFGLFLYPSRSIDLRLVPFWFRLIPFSSCSNLLPLRHTVAARCYCRLKGTHYGNISNALRASFACRTSPALFHQPPSPGLELGAGDGRRWLRRSRCRGVLVFGEHCVAVGLVIAILLALVTPQGLDRPQWGSTGILVFVQHVHRDG
jgi:hypothetical protein